MTSGNGSTTIRKAVLGDLDPVKEMADAHRRELGFVRRPALLEALRRNEILVADISGQVVGFVHYRHRRDGQTTLYDIVVTEIHQRQGIGQALIQSLACEARMMGKATIVLKCPEELPANLFYAHLGFEHWRLDPGKSRRLTVWRLSLSPAD